MVFLWFSYGFPMDISRNATEIPRQATRKAPPIGHAAHAYPRVTQLRLGSGRVGAGKHGMVGSIFVQIVIE